MSIEEFLKDRPSLSLRRLETEADLPTKTLSHYVNGRRKLSAEHIEKLTPVLSKYGFKQQFENDGWSVDDLLAKL